MISTQLNLFSSTPYIAPLMFDFGLEEVYQPPPPPAAAVPANRITFLPGMVTHDVAVKEWQGLPPEIKNGRLILTFSAPVTLQYNRRKRETKLVHTFRLFLDKTSGRLCNSLTGRSGWLLTDNEISRLTSIEPEPEKDLLSMVKKLANRIHPNVWGDLKTKLQTDPGSYLSNYGYTVTSISGKFPDYVLDNIRQAFKGKSNYSYDAGGYYYRNGKEKKTGRDLKVECKLCEDGIYRAWFYSEYPGCANGDYWLLINPTTAAFKETD